MTTPKLCPRAEELWLARFDRLGRFDEAAYNEYIHHLEQCRACQDILHREEHGP